MSDIISLTDAGGLSLFSTALVPWDIDRLRAQWWYVAPRNGHVSLMSQKSLELLAAEHRLRVRSDPGRVWHMLLDKVPHFAAHMGFPSD